MLKVVLLSLLLVTNTVWCEPPSELELCDKALDTCGLLVQQQDLQIGELQLQLKEAHDKLADAPSTPVLPAWAVIVISVASGFAIGYSLK